jgi:hypothetical protein
MFQKATAPKHNKSCTIHNDQITSIQDSATAQQEVEIAMTGETFSSKYDMLVGQV